MPSSQNAFKGATRGSATKLGPSVVLYEDFERFLRSMPSFDPRQDAGSQTAVRTFPDRTTTTVTYAPSGVWDDIKFSTTRSAFNFENRRLKTKLDGIERIEFDFVRLTIEDISKKRSLKLEASSNPDAVNQIAKMAREGVNRALSAKDLDTLAEKILREAPGIIASFAPSPSP